MELLEYTNRWNSQRLGSLFREQKKKNTHFARRNALKFTYGSIVDKPEYDMTPSLIDTYSKYTLVDEGDIVINCLNLNYDFVSQRVAIVKNSGIITSAYISLRARNADINPLYYCYYFKAMDARKMFHGMGTGIRLTLSYNELRNVPIPVPPRAEQDQIVRFLDWKVSEINKLIGIRRKEISLIRQYKELRITERLKGKKVWLKRLLKSPLQYGANSSGTDFSSNLPRYIRITDIDSDGNLKQDGAKSILEEDAVPYILEDGDILLARSGATVGKAFLYKKCYGLSAYAGYLIRAKFDNSRILPEYFMYFTNSSIYSDWKNSVFIQATIQNISAEKYGYLPIPLPSIDEQKRIVNELDLICKYMDSLVEIKYKEIHALQELKAVIISDVVTGKIDVRNVTVPEYEHVDDIVDDDSENNEETETDGEEA
jgi:type I restriction enzyme S subunit